MGASSKITSSSSARTNQLRYLSGCRFSAKHFIREVGCRARTIARRALNPKGRTVCKQTQLGSTASPFYESPTFHHPKSRNHGFWSRQRKHRRRSASVPEWPCRAISQKGQDQKDAQREHGSWLPQHAAEGGSWESQKGIVFHCAAQLADLTEDSLPLSQP